MSQEEKYKLALFAVVRNSTVMPQGVKLGKTMYEINTMAVSYRITCNNGNQRTLRNP